MGLFLMLRIKMLTPNNPESKGNNGWLMFRLRMINPREPDNKKMIKANSFLRSLRIKNIEAEIKMYGMNLEIRG